MQCFRCARPAIHYQRYSGRSLCARHLCADIESRAKRVIRQNRWLVRGDKIGVVHGMIFSEALEKFLGTLLSRRSDISLVRIDSPGGYVQRSPPWFQALSQIAADAGVTRIALPTSAEELAGEILADILRGDTTSLLGSEIPGMSIPVMHPLQEIPAEELEIYTAYQMDGADQPPISAAHSDLPEPFDRSITTLLTEYSSRHPSAPYALRRYRTYLRDIAGTD